MKHFARETREPTTHWRLCAKLEADGWNRKGWRMAAAEAFLRLPELTGREDAWMDTTDLLEWLYDSPVVVPDAWRIRVEGGERGWLHPVVVLEFVEVEVTHRVPDHKEFQYMDAFWMMDAGTEYAHFRVFRMDRLGHMSDFISEETMRDDSLGFVLCPGSPTPKR